MTATTPAGGAPPSTVGYAHFAVSPTDYVQELGLAGDPIRAWLEPDTLYLHVITAGPINGFIPDDPFRPVHAGGYIEQSGRPEVPPARSPNLDAATTRELLEAVAHRMDMTQNSTAGRHLGRLCLDARDHLDAHVLDRRLA